MRIPGLTIIAFLGLASLAAPLPVFAFDATQTYVQPQFLPPQLLVPPPAEGSVAWKKQIDQVLKAQHDLPQAEQGAIKDEQAMRLTLMTAPVGGTFTRENLPKTFAFLDRVLASTAQVSEADKKFWHTRRPYLTDPRVKLYIDPIDNSPSYPSGHTAESRVLAEVIGMLLPEKLSMLRARADAIARHRVEAGAHYPVDIDAGKNLAMLVVGALMANDDFQDDLAMAKKEIAASH